MLGVRQVVLTEIPSVSETVNDVSYAVTNGFTFSGRVKEAFCYVVAYSSYVNLGFACGAELPDPDRKLQGTGKLHRHLRIETLAMHFGSLNHRATTLALVTVAIVVVCRLLSHRIPGAIVALLVGIASVMVFQPSI